MDITAIAVCLAVGAAAGAYLTARTLRAQPRADTARDDLARALHDAANALRNADVLTRAELEAVTWLRHTIRQWIDHDPEPLDADDDIPPPSDTREGADVYQIHRPPPSAN